MMYWRHKVIVVVGFFALFFFYSLQSKHITELSLNTIHALDGSDHPLLAPFHEAWRQLRQLDCKRLFALDTSYIHSYVRSKRILVDDPDQLDVSCAAILGRWHFAKQPTTKDEAEFPLAFARTVFKDYSFLEHMLSVEYQPQNVYCYSLDAKTKASFKKRIRSLSSCFSNVFVVDKEYSVFSNGKNVTRSHLSCLQSLYQQSTYKWKYAFVLQNHDIPHKTNWEKVYILKLYKGANDISALKTMPVSVKETLNWTMASLHLYKDEERNKQLYYSTDGSLKVLKHTKSFNLVVLSRRAVQFVIQDLQLDQFIDKLEESRYGMDEVFFSTLNTNLPDFPGGFTYECLSRKRPTNNMGRYTLWQFDARCMSRKFRHDICVFGVEDLAHIDANLFQFYINKMLPNFDYGAIFCWLEKIKNIRPGGRQLNSRFYKNIPYVRFNHLRSQGVLNLSRDFDCA